MAKKNLEHTVECIDALEKEAAKIRRDNPGDAEKQAYIDGIRYANRKLKLALRADGLTESVQTLTNTPAAKRVPVGKKVEPPAKKTPAKKAAPPKAPVAKKTAPAKRVPPSRKAA